MPTPAEIDAACAFARHLARRLVPNRDAADDAGQNAALAILRAARRFDPARGVKWVTYAGDTAHGEILKTFRTKETRARQRRQRDGLPVPPEFLSPLRLDERLWNDEGPPERYTDLIADTRPWPGQWPGEELSPEALRAIAGLHPRLRQVLWYRFFEQRTQAETGRLVGVSQMEVYRCERRALAEVRRALGVFTD